MRPAFFAQLYSFRPFFTSFGCFAFRVLVVSLLLLPGRGPHSWLGGVRSSSPAWIDVDAIIGDGPGFFCSMVTGLSGQSARGAKKKRRAKKKPYSAWRKKKSQRPGMAAVWKRHCEDAEKRVQQAREHPSPS